MSVEIPKSPLLTAADEVLLAQRIEAAVFAGKLLESDNWAVDAGRAELEVVVDLGRRATERLYLANLRLVVSVANEWARKVNLPSDELFQDGCLGLGEAIRRWDWTRGVRFSTVAYKWILHHISGSAARRCGMVDVSQHAARAAWRQRRVWQRLEAREGRRLSAREFALATGTSVQRVCELEAAVGRAHLTPELADSLPLEEPVHQSAGLPEGWRSCLDADEIRIVTGRWGLTGEQLMFRDLAKLLRISEATVRRKEARALSKLRAWLAAHQADEAAA